MTDRPAADRWVAALVAALEPVLDAEEFDAGDGGEPGQVEVATDDWTLVIAGLVEGADAATGESAEPTAWLAIDDEPGDATQYGAARRAVMSDAIEQALAAADRSLDGALAAALIAGGDPFSADFAAALRELRASRS